MDHVIYHMFFCSLSLRADTSMHSSAVGISSALLLMPLRSCDYVWCSCGGGPHFVPVLRIHGFPEQVQSSPFKALPRHLCCMIWHLLLAPGFLSINLLPTLNSSLPVGTFRLSPTAPPFLSSPVISFRFFSFSCLDSNQQTLMPPQPQF